MVVRKNLSELYNTNLNGYACAGVVDSEYYNESFYQTLNIPQRYVYINSGMLLMNLEYWRENKCGERVLECIRQHPEFYWADQDAINMVLHKEILHVELRYNFQSLFYIPRKWKEYSDSFRNQILSEGKDPIIIHYSGSGKPWSFRYYGAPYHEDWDNVRKSSLWSDCKIKKPFIKYCKYLIKRYLLPSFLRKQIESSWVVVHQNKHCYHV